MPISDAEVERYARQLLLPGMGKVPQEFLRTSRVQVVGGGLVAGPAMLYLAQAGIGHLFVDDSGDLSPEDAGGWVYPPDQAGEPRAPVALRELRLANGFGRPRLFATGTEPSAVLICGGGAVVRDAAERARVAGRPHVVATAEGDGGSVVVVPVGAPCHACAFRLGLGVAPTPAAAAAVGALAAAELIMLIAGTGQPPQSRRIELMGGILQVAATVRRPHCACAPRAA